MVPPLKGNSKVDAGAYGADVDDEVDEFSLNRHGTPPMIMVLKTNVLIDREDRGAVIVIRGSWLKE
jgi:hypothetical protein